MRRIATNLLGGALLLFALPAWPSSAPEIAHVYPDFMGAHDDLRQKPHRRGILRHTPQIITGEKFDSLGLRMWVWAPPEADKATLKATLEQFPKDGELKLPDRPPEEARQIQPLDVETQVIVAVLSHWRQRRSVLWVGNKNGFSAPYLYNVAKPLWLSDEELAPGELLRVFGYGLRREYRDNWVALKKGKEVIFLQDYGRTKDKPSRFPFYIAYETRLLEMTLPKDVAVGEYEVYVHNGWGGKYGWRKAGDLRITPQKNKTEHLFNVRRAFGAAGDGINDDTAAIQTAVKAAAKAGGGIVYFPPGTYRINESLRVPSGITLRGAGKENTIIEGFGFRPGGKGGHKAWYSSLNVPYSVVLLEPHTGLERLAVKGSVARGGGGLGQVELVEDKAAAFPGGAKMGRVLLSEVHLHSPVFHPDYGTTGARFYASAVRAGSGWRTPVYRLKILNSIFEGDIRLGKARRVDIIGNTLRGGAIQSGGLFDSLIDANVMEDNPNRMYSYRPVWNTYYRANEIRDFGRRRVSGASEPFMFHGGGGKAGGRPTGAGADTLSDARQAWKPGQFRDQGFTVLITDGRGFGQYRRVVDNTKDTLILDEPWRVVPDETSEYVVGGFFVNSVFSDNVNSGLGRMTLWLDCINTVVENHRDKGAGGIDIWGHDSSNKEKPGKYGPSWYNMLLGNDLAGSRIYLHDATGADNVWKGPVLFGNYIVSNNLIRPLHRNVGESTYPTAGIDAGVDAYRNRTEPPDRRSGRNRYTMIINNTIAQAEVGIRVPTGIRKAFILRNDFMEVKLPIINLGFGTVISEGNRHRSISPVNGQISERLLPDSAR